MTARPLRDVFTGLVGAPGATDDPAALLRDQGHELPDDLVAEAVVSYADTAPAEVAEHLAPFVTAHSAVGAGPGGEPPAGWLDLLGSAPEVIGDEPAGLDPVPAPGGFDDAGSDAALDFGSGAGPGAFDEGGVDDGGRADEASVEITTDPADAAVDETEWAPAEPVPAEPAAELSDEDDDGDLDGEPLG